MGLRSCGCAVCAGELVHHLVSSQLFGDRDTKQAGKPALPCLARGAPCLQHIDDREEEGRTSFTAISAARCKRRTSASASRRRPAFWRCISSASSIWKTSGASKSFHTEWFAPFIANLRKSGLCRRRHRHEVPSCSLCMKHQRTDAGRLRFPWSPATSCVW